VNKAHLVRAVATGLGIPPNNPVASEAVDAVLDAIVRAVVAGERVTVTGFGTLEAVDVPAREMRNPQTGGRMQVPARRRVRFRPGAQFAAYVQGSVPIARDDQWAVRKAPKGSKSAGGAR
jgi:DNA-binding protein HU-beta